MKCKLLMFILLFSQVSLIKTQPLREASPPYQFIAKMYTEALGRAPSPSEWLTYQNSIESNNNFMNLVWYQVAIKNFYKDPEYYQNYPTTDPYWKKARLLSFYRGVFSNEPTIYDMADSSQFHNNSTWEYYVNNVVNDIINSPNFTSYFLDNINSAANAGLPYYGWGTNPPLTIIQPTAASKLSTTAFNGTEQDLQTLLDQIGENADKVPKIISLAPMAVIEITTTLRIPPFVTLQTANTGSRNAYAKMARIVKKDLLNKNITSGRTDMIWLREQSKLERVWLSGQFTILGKDELEGHDLAIVANHNTTAVSTDNIVITDNRMDDASGSNFIKIHTGSAVETGTRQCDNATVVNNLLTGYGTSHMRNGHPWTIHQNITAPWAEGIDIGAMRNGTISHNQIVDVTDGGICAFHTRNSLIEINTQIHNNRILNAGNSGVAGLVMDPEYVGPNGRSGTGTTYEYRGINFYDNIIWTSPTAHIDYPIHIGAFSEYRLHGFEATLLDKGINGLFIGNNSGVCSISSEIGVLVDGISGFTWGTNNFNFRPTKAYHSRFNSDYARFSNTIPAGAVPIPLTPGINSFQDFEFLRGDRDLQYYIDGPDEIYNNIQATFKLKAMTNNNPFLVWRWAVQHAEGNEAQIYVTPSTSNTSFIFNPSILGLTSTQWIAIRIVHPTTQDYVMKKYVRYHPTFNKNNEISEENVFPVEYSLTQNYPNPFNPKTQINYSIKENGIVRLDIYNILGQRVAQLINQFQEAGNHSVMFDASNLNSGVYIYKLQSNGFSDSKKLILLK